MTFREGWLITRRLVCLGLAPSDRGLQEIPRQPVFARLTRRADLPESGIPPPTQRQSWTVDGEVLVRIVSPKVHQFRGTFWSPAESVAPQMLHKPQKWAGCHPEARLITFLTPL